MSWKTEYVNIIPKVFPPLGFGDLRNLSLTEYFSKRFEEFILNGSATVKGLLFYIEKFIDKNQFAVKGASCYHALISIINFILKHTDKNEPPKAVVNLLADWSKAFNNVNHNIVMRILIFLGVPQWILRLILSYLKNRKMIVRFRGCESPEKDIPGSAPQGTLLGVVIYLLYINPIGFPGEATLDIHEALTSYWCQYDIPNYIQPQNEPMQSPKILNATKFMDDATCQEVVDIKSSLCSNIDRSGPLPFHESSGKVLPGENSLLQDEYVKIKTISDQREMILNAKKTVLFVVNFTKIHQFKPLLKIPGENKYLEVVQETKLLGYWLTSDMKPHTHICYIIAIANKRIWTISKLKKAGVSDTDLKFFYEMKIRSVLETSAVVYHSMLTKEDSNNIERVQRVVVRTIMGTRYHNYEDSSIYLNLEELSVRREQLCLTFALKCFNSEKFKHLFIPTHNSGHNVREVRRLLEPLCERDRYQNSPLVYLTRILNKYFSLNTDNK